MEPPYCLVSQVSVPKWHGEYDLELSWRQQQPQYTPREFHCQIKIRSCHFTIGIIPYRNAVGQSPQICPILGIYVQTTSNSFNTNSPQHDWNIPRQPLDFSGFCSHSQQPPRLPDHTAPIPSNRLGSQITLTQINQQQGGGRVHKSYFYHQDFFFIKHS